MARHLGGGPSSVTSGLNRQRRMSPMHQHDHSPDEIESREELQLHLTGDTLHGLTVQGLHLAEDPPDWAKVDVTGTLFIGCQFDSSDTELELIRRGAHVIP